ncbi:MurR/RpiR family transcriptional regulator [Caldanaerobacter subterraneus]|uniref:RpiR family transcriptional regulator n=1 Tax=Caldanaerobacter subterraneus TaxID=911092 RepID=A0A4V2S6J3_9THEO|nr:MurR/RpiR family transcriptional regulator [Caldanaerobacter subterraneus]TCO56290.1 RpiR family transcriptional regulator [Caldanaerobacter subterraneus]
MPGDIEKIKAVINNLKPSERKIAEYIIENADKISDLSVAELAKNSNTSEASVVRFCKSLGYKGYQDLKIKIAADYTYKTKSIQGVVNIDDDINTIIVKISKNNMDSIEKTMDMLDRKEVERAVNAILNANKIDIYGVGASAIVAQDMLQKFMRINKSCTAYNDSHMQLASAANLRQGDVAIGISYSGQTADTVDALRIAKKSGATTICITKFGNSPITEVSDIKLFVYSTEALFRSGAMASRMAQLNVVDILFSIVAIKKYDDVIKYLENTSEAVSSRKY